jgi:hypothetical protein
LRFYIGELLGYEFGFGAEKIPRIFVKIVKYIEEVKSIYLESFKLPTNNVLPNRNVIEVFRMKTPDLILKMEILAKSNKDNQKKVIGILQKLGY